MTKDNSEYKAFVKEYEAQKQYRHDHSEEYPWMIYKQFGWHDIDNLTDEEAEEAIKFYHLWKRDDNHYQRVGRQPIFLIRRANERGGQDE